MKRSLFLLPLIAFIGIFTSVTYSQENNYIVSKYDFIPGEKVIFFDDFTSESIGDFPAQWLTNGSGEIVTSEKFPGRWFHLTKMGYFIPEAKEDFTENFTIEFDFIPMTTDNSENIYGFTFYLLAGILSEPGGGGEPGDAGFLIYLDNLNIFWKNWSAQTGQRFDGMVAFPFRSGEKYHVALWVQKQRVRLYANENKVLDVPRAIPAGSKPNIFRLESDQVSVPLIGNFRIAAGLPDMRNRLLKDGKIISYGIQFDINSDELKPESYSTLKVIADLLKENPEIRLQIVGHTDSDGDDASNLDLSKRRGASVKNELVNKFACDAARLESDGKGESEPVADNNSAVNKAKNRRVEFINIKEKQSTPSSTVTAKSPATQKSGSLTDTEGNSYKIVTIGNQTWMAENLKTTKYNDGTPIPMVTDSAKWMDTTTPAFCWFKNDASKYKNPYGALYNWFTIGTGKLCPTGWHVPTDADWSALKKFVGPSENTEVDGGKLKEAGTSHWKTPNSGATNSTGFSAVATGYREEIGRFYTDLMRTGIITEDALWWSASEDPTTAEYSPDKKPVNGNIVGLSYNYNGVAEGSYGKSNGLSVRCIKD
jgi:OOP family OmpA-OmpF porin